MKNFLKAFLISWIATVAASGIVFVPLFSALAQPTQPAVNQSGAVVTNNIATWAGTRLIKDGGNFQSFLNGICSVQGSVLYRNASAWVCIGPGSNGQFLTTQGAGANPVWSSGGVGTGTVTSVELASPNGTIDLTGTNPITTLGTINLDLPAITSVNTEGDGQNSAVVTVDVYGRVTTLTSATIAPPFTAITGSLACSQLPAFTGGDVTSSAGSCVLALPNVISAAGPIGAAGTVPIITYDAKGRLTTVTSAAISIPFTSVTGQATLAQLPTIADLTALGNITGAPAVPAALTATQITANLINDCTATVAGRVPTPPNNTTTFLRGDCTFAAPAIPAVNGIFASRNNTSRNNTGTPLTQFDLIASRVVLENSSNEIVTVTSPGTLTNNTATAGSTAGGRDQAGAFTASTFVHFYWIWNGSAISSLSSASATAPTLPSGYTHFAYAGAVYYNASSQLLSVFMRGDKVFYAAPVQIVTDGRTQPAETSISLTASVPTNALSFMTYGGGYCGSGYPWNLRIVSGTNWIGTTANSWYGSCGVNGYPMQLEIPNTGFFAYQRPSDPTAGFGLFLWVTGYTVPNNAN